jgi:hypothetical protein
MKKVLLAWTFTLLVSSKAHAYLAVEDIPGYIQKGWMHLMDYAKYAEQVYNQETQIQNQVTQITQTATQIKRFGDPQFYVNLLNLSAFTATASNLSQGVGRTIGQFRSSANGVQALGYTANGLYSNLTNAVDRFGQPVQYATDSFRKFGAVNQMYDSYDQQLRTYNQQMASLQQQLTDAVNRMNAASTQMEHEKYAALVNAISAQMNALGHTTVLTGQRVIIQHSMNQSDAARVQEAQRQQLIQERGADLKKQAAGLSTWIDADPGTGN